MKTFLKLHSLYVQDTYCTPESITNFEAGYFQETAEQILIMLAEAETPHAYDEVANGVKRTIIKGKVAILEWIGEPEPEPEPTLNDTTHNWLNDLDIGNAKANARSLTTIVSEFEIELNRMRGIVNQLSQVA